MNTKVLNVLIAVGLVGVSYQVGVVKGYLNSIKAVLEAFNEFERDQSKKHTRYSRSYYTNYRKGEEE